MSPSDRFDPQASQAAADDAIEKVTANANAAWKEEARSALQRVARVQLYFTTDHIWAMMDPTYQTHEPRAMGGILRWAQSERIAENTLRFQKTARVSAHRRPLAIWKSLIVENDKKGENDATLK